MKINTEWTDYEIIATGDGEKLERWGDVVLLRPDPQVIWHAAKPLGSIVRPDARYVRSNTGGGHWQYNKPIPDEWQVGWRNLRFAVKPMGFKHTGLFPEQAANWATMIDLIGSANRPINVLNLFAYTGGATLACASAGASVCHVDASRGMVQWARENARLSGLSDRPIRWIVDDCRKFIEREIRRGHTYDAIIMDPPSYGRGPSGEVWKIEDDIASFLELAASVLSENPLFVLISSYTAGLSPSVMDYLLGTLLRPRFGGKTDCSELGLLCTSTGQALPCGSAARWILI